MRSSRLLASLILWLLLASIAQAAQFWPVQQTQVAARVVPSTANRAYVLTASPWGTALVYRFERNIGGSDITDCGTPWQPWRRTGTFEVATINSDPTVPIYTFGADIGAFDYNVQRGTIFINGLSYHGCEVVASEAITLSGAAIDFMSPLTGTNFKIQHTSTGTFSDASTVSVTYSLQATASGLVEATALSSAAAMAGVTNPNMDIGANDFTQAIVNGVTTDVTTSGDYAFAKAQTVTLRSPTTGYTLTNSSSCPALPVYAQTQVTRIDGLRSKIYFRSGSTGGAPLGTISCGRSITYGKGAPG
jgi:hypothetical protein